MATLGPLRMPPKVPRLSCCHVLSRITLPFSSSMSLAVSSSSVGSNRLRKASILSCCGGKQVTIHSCFLHKFISQQALVDVTLAFNGVFRFY
ncbi:hypothetical protein E2C01_007365 [Portunus trituberculatus]|uniref:Uncharacterized protein n=1 Tax=Portunus trituberculatus TaxID=210409 RepID=A0A5B7CZ96_PORTR|nr:hypothetical protein [Portunus trituberculatus]